MDKALRRLLLSWVKLWSYHCEELSSAYQCHVACAGLRAYVQSQCVGGKPRESPRQAGWLGRRTSKLWVQVRDPASTYKV